MPVTEPSPGVGVGKVTSGEHKGASRMPGDMATTKYELEDYVYEMECRAGEMADGAENEDVYSRLAQKERDLILAAELGKALLERNELLVQQNERLAEDYSHKLEVRHCSRLSNIPPL